MSFATPSIGKAVKLFFVQSLLLRVSGNCGQVAKMRTTMLVNLHSDVHLFVDEQPDDVGNALALSVSKISKAVLD